MFNLMLSCDVKIFEITIYDDVGKQQLYLLGDSCGIYDKDRLIIKRNATKIIQ